jgi:hypothetical protein
MGQEYPPPSVRGRPLVQAPGSPIAPLSRPPVAFRLLNPTQQRDLKFFAALLALLSRKPELIIRKKAFGQEH